MNNRHDIAAIAIGLGLSLAWSCPAAAKPDYKAVYEAMTQCSAIVDLTERAGCYDRTIAEAKAGKRNSNDETASANSPDPAGFGSETMDRQERPKRDEIDSVTRTVSRSRLVQPGIYLVDFDDGTQWQFVEGVPLYFSPPKKGAKVEIRRGALGSFVMKIPGRAPVRVKRMR